MTRRGLPEPFSFLPVLQRFSFLSMLKGVGGFQPVSDSLAPNKRQLVCVLFERSANLPRAECLVAAASPSG